MNSVSDTMDCGLDLAQVHSPGKQYDSNNNTQDTCKIITTGYTLIRDKALKQKQKATARDFMVVEDRAQNIVISFNTASFEYVKSAIYDYYQLDPSVDSKRN